jgi:4-amino-4-deoxy-L-arabinose transferase-like glycosyltransferase
MSRTDNNQASQQTHGSPNRIWWGLDALLHRLSMQGWWLLAIVLLAFFARMVLVHYGLPLLLYEDEPIYYDHALGFGLGQWDIGYFKKPSFFLYFYAAFYYLAYLYTPFMDWKNYVDAFWQNPTYVATVGRTLSVAFAAGTVALVGKIGQRAFGWWVGLAAALWMAVDFTHLRISPIVISDIPALFFVMLAAWFALKISKTGARKDYLWCAISIALAASFKYNVFSVLFLLAGHTVYQLSRDSANTEDRNASGWRHLLLCPRLWMSLLLIPALFLLLNPMILKDFSTFWAHLNLEKRHMLQRNPADPTAHWQPMAAFGSIFFKILPRAQGWLLYIPGLLGMVWGLWKYRRQSLVLLSFPLVFLLVVLQFQLINAKYLLPLFPFWYLMAALFYRDVFRRLTMKWPRPYSLAAGTLLVIAVSFWTWMESAKHLATYSRADTRNIATTAIQRLVRPNDTLLLEPDTLTLDNRLFRSWLVRAQYTNGQFQIENLAPDEMHRITLDQYQPRWVLLNFGEAQKQKASQGNTVYTMPYLPAYYRTMQRQYTLKATFAPYTIHLSQQQMTQILHTEGFGALYGEIQRNKTSRLRPGPFILLMEKTGGTPD